MPAMPGKVICCLCGKSVHSAENCSSYRIEGEVKGFAAGIDLRKVFHNECLTREKGVNEIARAQVLDYLEAVQFNESIVDDLKSQNLERAQKLLKQREWRSKYDRPKA